MQTKADLSTQSRPSDKEGGLSDFVHLRNIYTGQRRTQTADYDISKKKPNEQQLVSMVLP